MKKEMPEPSATPVRPSSFVSLLSGWMQQGVESIFSTQKIFVDLAMRQNATAMKSLRDGLSDPENSPTAILTEIAVEGTANFIEAQRILLNFVQEESTFAADTIKENAGMILMASNMTDTWKRSLDTMIEGQQEYLTIVNKNTQKWLHNNKAGKGFDATCAVEFAREAMDNFVGAQKKFLDVVSEESSKAMNGPAKTEKKMNKTAISKVAREAANAYVDAQKKLLDLASQQMNVNMNAAKKTMEMMSPMKLTPLSNFTGEGVKSLVEAEKALIDSMTKARTKEPMKTATAKKTRKPAAKTAHATA